MVNAGETDKVSTKVWSTFHEVFRKKQPWKLEGGLKYLAV